MLTILLSDCKNKSISSKDPNQFFEFEESHEPSKQGVESSIPLSIEDNKKLYTTWQFSLVIKDVGKRFNHQYLKTKLSDLWKLKKSFALINLGLNYYNVKLGDALLQKKITQEGLWFVVSSYLSVRVWEPNLIPKESQIQTTAIWIGLPQLPTEFNDTASLKKVGSKIRRLLKIDV